MRKNISRIKRICLLYTSDAADERSSVDLGGRRIIKKKTTLDLGQTTVQREQRPPYTLTHSENKIYPQQADIHMT